MVVHCASWQGQWSFLPSPICVSTARNRSHCTCIQRIYNFTRRPPHHKRESAPLHLLGRGTYICANNDAAITRENPQPFNSVIIPFGTMMQCIYVCLYAWKSVCRILYDCKLMKSVNNGHHMEVPTFYSPIIIFVLKQNGKNT